MFNPYAQMPFHPMYMMPYPPPQYQPTPQPIQSDSYKLLEKMVELKSE